jgi:hypothetical protein
LLVPATPRNTGEMQRATKKLPNGCHYGAQKKDIG